MKTHVMVKVGDYGPGSGVKSISAVKFNQSGLLGEFNLLENELWVKGDTAKRLLSFKVWLNGETELNVWSKYPSVELSKLRALFRQEAVDCPWTLDEERCYSTLANLAPGIQGFFPLDGPLEIAKAQAQHMTGILLIAGVWM